MFGKTQKISLSPIVCDFLKKLFVLLAVLYIILFGVETILPGIVMDIFNINTLLFLIIIDLFLLGTFLPGQDETSTTQFVRVLKNPSIFPLVIFLSFVLVAVLYRISLIEGLIYLILTLIIGKLIFGLFKG